MPVETDADRAAMLADFGLTVTIDDGAVPAVTFTAIFDNAYIEASFSGATGVATRAPMLVARSSDVASLGTDTRLLIAGTAYLTKEIQPDGTGMSTVLLELA